MFMNGWTLCLVLFGVCCLAPQGTDGIECYQCSYRADNPTDFFCLEDLSWYSKSQLNKNSTCQYGQECFVTYTIHEESNTVVYGTRGCSSSGKKNFGHSIKAGGQTFYVSRRSCFDKYCNYWPVVTTVSGTAVQPIAAPVVLLGAVAMYVYTNL